MYNFDSAQSDLHQVVFKWPHTEPTTVIVSGTFDEWSSSIHLVKTPSGFEGATQIPWEQKIKFKFIVDGEWRLLEDYPTEVDPGGFVNNIYTAPTKPVILPALETTPFHVEAEKPAAIEANSHGTNGDSVVAEVAEKSEYTPQTLLNHTQPLTGTTDGKIAGTEPKTSDTQTSGFPQLLSDLASTIAARDGTSSALAYVASGLGAAMHSAVGIDPINIPKIGIPTPKYNDDFTLPPGLDTVSPAIMEESAPQLPPSPIAPLVPIVTVPVNTAENNTTASSPSPESIHILPRFSPRPEITRPDTNGVLDVDAVTEKAVVDVHTVPEVVIKESATSDTEVTPMSDAVESAATEEKPCPDPAVVDTTYVSESGVEKSTAADTEVTGVIDVVPFKVDASTEGTIESAPAPITDILPTSETVIHECASVAEAIPIRSKTPVEKFPEGQPLDEAPSMAVQDSQGQHKDSEVSTCIQTTHPEPDLDVNPTVATGSAEAPFVSSNEIIVPPIPEPMSFDEMKSEEGLSPESKEGRSEKKSERDAVVEIVVESIPATIIETPASGDLTPIFHAVESMVDSEPAEVIPPTESNLVTEEKAQTSVSASEVKDVQTTIASPSSNEHTTEIPKPGECTEPSAITPDSHAVNSTVVTERKLAEPTPTPQTTVLLATNGHFTSTTPRKEAPGTGSVKSIQEFPSSQTDSPSQTTDNSPSSSKFNSTRKKRSSIFGKIKNIFHHDKEKEKK